MEKYGDDAVLKAIVSAKQVENTKEVATKLETELFSIWMKNAQSVDDVFNSLKLREEGEKILVGHKFELLENYLVYSNRMEHRDESLTNVLTKGFGGEDGLVLALSSARINEHVQNKIKELVTPIFLRKIDDQMKNFQMNNGVESILRSQELPKLASYISGKVTRWGVDISLLGVLVTKYGDRAVAKALATAKTADGENIIVRHLQKQQFVTWQKKGKSTDAVFKYLELHKLEGNVVNSPLLDTLQGYIKVYNHATRAEETFLGTLIKGFGRDNKFAAMLEKASTIESTNTKATELRPKLFEYWWDEGVDSWKKLIYDRFGVPNTEVGNKVQLKIMADYAKFLATKGGVSNGVNLLNITPR